MTEPSQKPVSGFVDHVRKYLNLGHVGYVLWYRGQIDKDGPTPEWLQAVMQEAERSKTLRYARWFRAFAEAIS